MIQLTDRSRDILIRHALNVLAKQNDGRGAPVSSYNGDDHAYATRNALKEAGVQFPSDPTALAFVLEILQRAGGYRNIRDSLQKERVMKVAAPTSIDTRLLD